MNNNLKVNNQERELYLEILSTTMSGKCIERFFIFNGKDNRKKIKY